LGPALKKKIRLPKQKRLPHAIADAEVRKLLALTTNPIRRTCFALMYTCGLRTGEAVSLEIPAIDGCKHLLTIIGKGNKERLVPLPDPMLWSPRRPVFLAETDPRIAAHEDDLKHRDDRIKELRRQSWLGPIGHPTGRDDLPARQGAVIARRPPPCSACAAPKRLRPKAATPSGKDFPSSQAGRSVTAIGYRAFFLSAPRAKSAVEGAPPDRVVSGPIGK
jgi:hypothetical protein